MIIILHSMGYYCQTPSSLHFLSIKLSLILILVFPHNLSYSLKLSFSLLSTLNSLLYTAGVRDKYLTIGDRAQIKGFSKGAYFVGKLAWAKGLDLLFQQMNFVTKR